MKVLLLHPEDTLWDGPWSATRWDLVVDLGWAGPHVYHGWRSKLGCPVVSLCDFGRELDDLRRVNELFDLGRRRIVDAIELDWWEILSPLFRVDLLAVLLIFRLADRLDRDAEVACSRPCLEARALGSLRGTEVKCLARARERGAWRRLQRYGRAASTMRPAQLLEVALDKWDPAYALRRWIAPRTHRFSGQSLVLLPSAYVNASRVSTSYAKLAPHRRFLLVTTRPSGRLVDLPSNVATVPLASYAPGRPAERRELRSLVESWMRVRSELAARARELAVADRLGIFAAYPALLRRGLSCRAAWQQVFSREAIEAVLTGDENNPYTRIPSAIAAGRGLPTVCCHHGALDATMLMRKLSSGVYLVKGEMERNYLVETCGLPPARVAVGAPHEQAGGAPYEDLDRLDEKTRTRHSDTESTEDRFFGDIIFFSEPYELYGGRVEEAYRELLPPLCKLARSHGRKVTVKLHPFESREGRARLVASVLSPEDRSLVQVVDGPASPKLLRRAWFGLTVESSVAVDCARARVPCFLCGWLEIKRHAYIRQYASFGAGYVLAAPADIERIPALLGAYRWPARPDALARPMTAAGLDHLLSGGSLTEAATPPPGTLQAVGVGRR